MPAEQEVELGIAGLTDAVEIGRGGFAVVYRAFQPAFERFVAVKVFDVLDADEATPAVFERECRAIGRISGRSNIVTVYEAGLTSSRRPFLTMAYLARGSLEDRMRREGPMRWADAVGIGVKLAKALQLAHEAGVLHRDVKPGNVLISDDGEPLLADFGIARLSDASSKLRSRTSFTPAHAAPEVLAGGDPTAAMDIYSLASSLFALVVGRPPFVEAQDDSLFVVMRRVAEDPVPDLLRPRQVPDVVCRSIEAALAKDPADRPLSAAAFRAALEAALEATLEGAKHGPNPEPGGAPERPLPGDVSPDNGSPFTTPGTIALPEAGIDPGAAIRSREKTIELVPPGRDSPERSRAGSKRSVPHNLPLQLTSFIGRTEQIQQLRAAVASRRLCTLTGTGGSGKSRLAVQFAREVVDSFGDGVWLVDMAPTPAPELVAQVVATALGVREGGTGTYAPKSKRRTRSLTERLVEHLRHRQVLLVVDNCDRVVQACAELVEALLGTSPGLRVLCTSREPLGVAGEFIYRVPPLAVPPPGQSFTEVEVRAFESVQLFLERAEQRRPDLRIEGPDLDAVVQICQRLEGLALAIELAAARVEMLSPREILDLLEDRFGLLSTGRRTASPRHRTLKAMIDWSYDDLEAAQQVLLRRLSVFAGGFDLAAAQHVCSGDGLERFEILDLLAILVDKSLVETEKHAAVTRYRLLVTIRSYGREKLAEAGEDAALKTRHRDRYLARAETAESGLTGPDQVRCLDLLELDHDNLRAALDLEPGHDDTEAALRLAAALGHFWLVRGLLTEGRNHLEAVLARPGPRKSVPRARALAVAGNLAVFDADLDTAARCAGEALELSAELGYRQGEASALRSLGTVASGRERLGDARALQDQALAISQELGDQWGIALSFGNIANLEAIRGHFAEASQRYEDALAIRRALDDAWGMTWSLFRLGVLRTWQCRFDDAGRLLTEDLSLAARLRYGGGAVLALLALGDLAHVQGDQTVAKAHYRDALTQARQLQDQSAINLSVIGLASAATASGEHDEVRRWLASTESRFSVRSVATEVALLRGEARLARALGEHERAVDLHRKALEICHRLEDLRGVVEQFEELALGAVAMGDLERAATLFAAAESFRDAIGAPVPPLYHDEIAAATATARRAEVAWKQGSSLSVAEAVALALS